MGTFVICAICVAFIMIVAHIFTCTDEAESRRVETIEIAKSAISCKHSKKRYTCRIEEITSPNCRIVSITKNKIGDVSLRELHKAMQRKLSDTNNFQAWQYLFIHPN